MVGGFLWHHPMRCKERVRLTTAPCAVTVSGSARSHRSQYSQVSPAPTRLDLPPRREHKSAGALICMPLYAFLTSYFVTGGERFGVASLRWVSSIPPGAALSHHSGISQWGARASPQVTELEAFWLLLVACGFPCSGGAWVVSAQAPRARRSGRNETAAVAIPFIKRHAFHMRVCTCIYVYHVHIYIYIYELYLYVHARHVGFPF